MADEDKKEQVKVEEAPPKKGGMVKWVIIGVAPCWSWVVVVL